MDTMLSFDIRHKIEIHFEYMGNEIKKGFENRMSYGE